jgi:pimeloyl-ACP methyl ester carboxylesterase
VGDLRVKPLVLVHGTWGRAAAWHRPGSEFRLEADQHGFACYDFLWSGVLAGVPTALPGDPALADVGADVGMLLPWVDAAEKLLCWLEVNRTPEGIVLGACRDVTVCSHSHGLQVVALAAAQFQPFAVAVSVSGPIRRDMQRARRKAQGSIGAWIQFADPTGTDRTIIEGEMFDGTVGAHFDLPEGRTIVTPGSGHSGVLTDPAIRKDCAFWEAFP